MKLTQGPAGLLWFLLFHLRTVGGKVVKDFQECSWFFQGKVPPQGFENNSSDNLVRICQKYKDHYHFATLYRTDLRTPVYSAYRYPCSMGEEEDAHKPSPWFQEPQIDDLSLPDEMVNNINSHGELQALNSDYEDEEYQQGHMYPFSLNNKTSATSTCTLTNAVPMTQEANMNWYHEAEAVVAKLARTCHKSGRLMYLVTGSANPTEKKLKNRVSVPGSVWTTFCCTFPQDQNNDPCQSSPVNEELEGEQEVTYNKDFSYAFMKDLESEAKAEYLTVSEVQHRLGVDNIFNGCGTDSQDEGEISKEIEELINQIKMNIDGQEIKEDIVPQMPSEDNIATDDDDLVMKQNETPLEQTREEINEAISPSIINILLAPFEMFANVTMTLAHLVAAVLRVFQVLAVTCLRIPFGIIYDSASCLAIMAKYLFVTVFSVPQDLLSIMFSIASDTANAISCVGRLFKYLVRIL